MIGKYQEKDFDVKNYNDFYSHHNFTPIKDGDYTEIHEIIPRFGWAFDVIWDAARGFDRSSDRPFRVLDLGCLEGSFLLSVAKHQPWVIGTGVDLTVDGIELATLRAKNEMLPLEFHQGTIESWLEIFANEGVKFDVVSAFEVMEHVEDPEAVLKAIDKVLSPGGRVLISTPDFESPAFGKDDEQNKCHIRLYTVADDDYEGVNKYGTTRKATSISKQIGAERIKHMEVVSHLINVEYA